MGSFSYIESLFYRFVLFFDKVPAMVLTPLVFVFVPVGNPAIITLVVFAVAPTIILDTFLKAKEVPREQTIKGMTLRASVLENVFRITYKQIIPKVYDSIRLNFKSVINMLIVGELLGAEAGLGYRIFLVRRYMDMATIIPYIIILGTIVFLLDMFARKYIVKRYVWLNK
jgi:NitT/TauT family transport system permease protein